MSIIKLQIEDIGSAGELGNIVNYVLDTQTNSNVSNTSYKVDVSGVFDVLDIATEGSSGIVMASDDGSDALDLVFDDNDNLSSYAVEDGVVEDEENPSEFIWGVVPEDGLYSVKLTFTDAKDLRFITIHGDSVVGQYPVEAIIDGQNTLINNKEVWNIDLGEPSDTHTVEFTKWNKVNYSACLTRIMVSIRYLELGREFVKSFNSLSQSTTTPSTIGYGVMANSGTAEINDIDGRLKGYIDSGVIENSNMKIELYVNDNKIQTHITTDSSYVEEDKLLNLQLTNGLSRWSEITYSGRPLSNAMYADELLIEVLKTLEYTDEQIDKSLSNLIVFGPNNITGSVKDYLHTIYIPYPYLKSSTYREVINKFCDLAQLNVYADENDLPIFINARPVASVKEIDSAIKVTPAMQISNVSKTIILKNKYDAVDTYVTDVKEQVDVDAYVGGWKSSENDIDVEYTNTDKSVTGTLTNSYAQVRAGFVSGSITIPIKSNNNLDTVLDINTGADKNGNPKIQHYITGTKTTESGSFGSGSTVEDWSGTLATFSEFKYVYSRNETISLSLADKSNLITLTPRKDNSGENFIIDFTVAVYLMTGGWSRNNNTSALTYREATTYEFKELEISVYGVKKTIKFEDINASSLNVSTARTVATLNNNELRQTKALVVDVPVIDAIKNNILTDYKKGVQSGSVDLFAGNFSNANSEEVLTFKKGQLIKPYDILIFNNDLKPDGTQRYWRVTGNNFKYEGEPVNPVEIQEIAAVYEIPKFTVTFPSSVYVYQDGTRISSGSQVEGGTRLRVSKRYSDATLEYLRVNGTDISNNSYITVNSNVLVTIKYSRTIEISDRESPSYRASSGKYDIVVDFYDYGGSQYTINEKTYENFHIEGNVYEYSGSTGTLSAVLVNDGLPTNPLLTTSTQHIDILRYDVGQYDEETGDPITSVVGEIQITGGDMRIEFSSSTYKDVVIEYSGIYLDATYEK